MIVVAYASKHGSTEGIAQHIAARLVDRGMQSEARPAADITDLAQADAVVLGSAIYAGSWMNEALEFVDRHERPLTQVPVWLFSSGPLGDQVADDEEQPRQLAGIRARVAPRDHRVFSGALDTASLGFGERMIAKAVKAPDGDFRDWDEITAWADEIAESV